MVVDVGNFRARRSAQLRRRVWMWPIDRFCYRLYFRMLAGRAQSSYAAGLADGQRVLVISPHQDDETLGSGGLLVSCRGRIPVQPVFVTSGKGPGWLRSDAEREALALRRTQEARLVCRRLGTEEPLFLGIDDADEARDARLTARLAEVIETFRPTVILAPFFADANHEHLWVTQCLAEVPPAFCERAVVLLYRTHAQMPARYQNVCFRLDERIHAEKEALLRLYETQKLHVDITLAKYLFYSRLWPAAQDSSVKSIERYCCLRFTSFALIQRRNRVDRWIRKVRSINYSPFSFGLFVRNEMLLRLSGLRRPPRNAVLSEQEIAGLGVFAAGARSTLV